MASPLPTSILLCEEDSATLHDSPSGILSSPPSPVENDDDDDYIQLLVTRECTSIDRPASVETTRDWLHFARCEAVRWILKERSVLGFAFETAYLAVLYLDSFLVRRTIENRQVWAVKLLSVACLTLAAKLEECYVPVLSDFRVDGFFFDGRSIQRMELIVLTTLEWSMRLITPFPFLNYLVSKSGCDVLVHAADMILASIESMNLVQHRPSALAVSAFFAATGRRLTVESFESDVGTISADGSLQADHVFSCYDKIQESWRKKRIDRSKYGGIGRKRKRLYSSNSLIRSSCTSD